MEPFLIRALAAGIGLAVIAAPLGCFLVWQRMAFFGETVAQASLIGVALALALNLDVTATVLGASTFVIGVIEGIAATDVPAFSVQHHPEAGPGPHDAAYLFEEFAALMGRHTGSHAGARTGGRG